MEVIAPVDEIGKRLRSARDTRGWSIDDVHFQTRLPKDVIRALESGDFGSFAGPVYARSFLTQYSDHLQVNASDWLGAIEQTEFVPEGDVLPVIDKRGVKPAKEAQVERQGSSSSWGPVFGFLATTALLVWGAVTFVRKFESQWGGEKKPSVVETPSAPQFPAAPAKDAQATELPVMADGNRETPPPRATIVREN